MQKPGILGTLHGRAWLTVAAILVATGCVHAADDIPLLTPVHKHHAELADKGLTFELSYTADFFYNLRGGTNTSGAEQYRGLAGLGISLDTEKLGWWEGGTFYVNVLDNHGSDISARHVGDVQALNNADAENDTRLYEYWYEHSLLSDRVRIKLGKMDANNEFAAPDYAGEFVNASSGFSPTIPFPTWPDPALGAMVEVAPADWLYVKAGLYDALGHANDCGTDTAFHSPDESITMAELGVRPTLSLFGQTDLPGTYRIGGFYHSSAWAYLLDGRRGPRSHAGNYGVYMVFDQALLMEQTGDEASEQGLGMFLQFGYSPSEYNEITQHYGGGLQYVGLFPSRDEDITGVSFQHVALSGVIEATEDRHEETAFELFHRFQLTSELSLKPDFQYIVDPGGSGRDAIVAGIRLEFSL